MTFIPKNIDTRATELIKIQAKQLVDFNKFVVEFQYNLQKIQGLKVTDPKEQLFIDLMQAVVVKVEPDKYPFTITLFNYKDQYIFEYDWKTDIFWSHYDKIWILFETKFTMIYQDWQLFILNQVEKYFKHKPLTAETAS